MVYLDTTIPSFYFETRGSEHAQAWRRITREWWRQALGTYRLVTSAFALEELERAPEPKASQMLDLLRDVEVLRVEPAIDELIAFYLEHRLMPADIRGDAAHLAMASSYRAEFLLTWNFKHLANVNKQEQITRINARVGLPTPKICAPINLMPEGFDVDQLE